MDTMDGGAKRSHPESAKSLTNRILAFPVNTHFVPQRKETHHEAKIPDGTQRSN